ncbi:hypothetical protein LWI29_017358 [Acer saccharum]|uniref:Transmembrane protein n=1 Tax=Acer saccharum TaxID=4024 RepID=A0AA39VT96_ACESA|nr:hypothetical protein LWI29_017358 [Acer saccharum]
MAAVDFLQTTKLTVPTTLSTPCPWLSPKPNKLALCDPRSVPRTNFLSVLTRCSIKPDTDTNNNETDQNPTLQHNSNSKTSSNHPSQPNSNEALSSSLSESPVVKRFLSDDEERWYMWYYGNSSENPGPVATVLLRCCIVFASSFVVLLFCSVAGVVIVAVVVLFRCRCDPVVLVPCYYCYCYFLEVDFACTSVAQAVVQSSPLVYSSLVGEFAASFLFVSPYLGCLTVGAGCPFLNNGLVMEYGVSKAWAIISRILLLKTASVRSMSDLLKMLIWGQCLSN